MKVGKYWPMALEVDDNLVMKCELKFPGNKKMGKFFEGLKAVLKQYTGSTVALKFN